MDRPFLPSLTSRIGAAMLLAAMALTALPAGAGAWSTAPDSGAKIVTTKSAKATKPARSQASATRTRTTPKRTAALTAPTRGPMALGVSLIEGNTPTEGDDLAALDAYAQRAGRMPASWSIWSDWGNKNKAFPSQGLLHALRARGVRPVIFWQPTGDDRLAHPTKYSYQSIVDGEWDAYLTSWAQDAKAWGGRVIVRWAHEMNGWWFPWAIGKIGNTPENYRAAWRHVVTTVRGIAPNVRFMWAPMRPCGTRCVDYSALYPGDAYVNVLGFSAYNWSGDPDTTMLRLYRRAINALSAVSSRKIIAAETGIKGPGPGRDRWLREGYQAIYQAFPRLRGVIYFDIDMSFLDEPEWRLMRSDNSLDTYSDILRDPRFMGKM
jgi:hypothetical protein